MAFRLPFTTDLSVSLTNIKQKKKKKSQQKGKWNRKEKTGSWWYRAGYGFYEQDLRPGAPLHDHVFSRLLHCLWSSLDFTRNCLRKVDSVSPWTSILHFNCHKYSVSPSIREEKKRGIGEKRETRSIPSMVLVRFLPTIQPFTISYPLTFCIYLLILHFPLLLLYQFRSYVHLYVLTSLVSFEYTDVNAWFT